MSVLACTIGALMTLLVAMSLAAVGATNASTRAYEETTGLTGFGQFSQKSEGGTVDYDTILQAYDKRFTHLTFSKGYQITMEAMDDDLDGAITNAAPALSRSARVSIETYIWNLFNLGFATETTQTVASRRSCALTSTSSSVVSCSTSCRWASCGSATTDCSPIEIGGRKLRAVANCSQPQSRKNPSKRPCPKSFCGSPVSTWGAAPLATKAAWR